MFPEVGLQTAMDDADFYFYFIDRKTAMRYLFINRT